MPDQCSSQAVAKYWEIWGQSNDNFGRNNYLLSQLFRDIINFFLQLRRFLSFQGFWVGFLFVFFNETGGKHEFLGTTVCAFMIKQVPIAESSGLVSIVKKHMSNFKISSLSNSQLLHFNTEMLSFIVEGKKCITGLCLSGFHRFCGLLSLNVEIQNCREETSFHGFTNIFKDLLFSVSVP